MVELKLISDLAVGDTIWIRDENHRKYVEDDGKIASRQMNWWASWRPVVIVEETSRSYVAASFPSVKLRKSLGPHFSTTAQRDVRLPHACVLFALSVPEIELWHLRSDYYALREMTQVLDPDTYDSAASHLGLPSRPRGTRMSPMLQLDIVNALMRADLRDVWATSIICDYPIAAAPVTLDRNADTTLRRPSSSSLTAL